MKVVTIRGGGGEIRLGDDIVIKVKRTRPGIWRAAIAAPLDVAISFTPGALDEPDLKDLEGKLQDIFGEDTAARATPILRRAK